MHLQISMGPLSALDDCAFSNDSFFLGGLVSNYLVTNRSRKKGIENFVSDQNNP